jgi:hypothetical protein
MDDQEEISKEAAALSRRGASQGGKARAERMTPEERSESSRRAAEARWGRKVAFAPHIGEIRIGDRAIECAVLEDGERRVINQASLSAAFDRTGGARRGTGAARLPLLSPLNIQSFITPEVRALAETPIEYRGPGGERGLGYPAQLLPMLCDIYLDAREQKVLTKSQQPVAAAAEILLRGLARVGIEALVDEATGYQDVRAKNALAKILEAFIAKELQPWVQTFPEDFYEQIFRLRGLDYPHGNVRRPQYFGHITNDIVYKRIAPGVLSELQRVTERTEAGRPRHRFHQRLTTNAGYPKLREHLGSVTSIMKLSKDWPDFMNKVDHIHPRYGETMPFPFDDEPDTGRGI